MFVSLGSVVGEGSGSSVEAGKKGNLWKRSLQKYLYKSLKKCIALHSEVPLVPHRERGLGGTRLWLLSS